MPAHRTSFADPTCPACVALEALSNVPFDAAPAAHDAELSLVLAHACTCGACDASFKAALVAEIEDAA